MGLFVAGGTGEAAGARVCSRRAPMLSRPALPCPKMGRDHHRLVKASTVLLALTARLLAAGKGTRRGKAFASPSLGLGIQPVGSFLSQWGSALLRCQPVPYQANLGFKDPRRDKGVQVSF